MPPAVYIRHGCIAGLLLLAGLFLSPFWHAILWAAIFTTMSWPVYDRLRQRWITHPNVTAFLMTLAIVAAITLPPLWMMTEIQQELPTLEELSTTPGSWRFSPEWLQGLPWPGNQAGYWLDSILADPWSHQGIRDYLSKTLLSGTTGLMKQLPHHIASAVLFVICLFFLLRHGHTLAEQLDTAIRKLSTQVCPPYKANLYHTTMAIGFGIMGSAILQGIIAGLGFALFDLETPLLLGLLTAIASMIPVFGTILIWGPVAAWMMLQEGDLSHGLGLLAWGALVVNPADNILRPLIISNSAQQPLPIIVAGVMGGLFSIGPLGIFLGPLCLTTLLLVWKEWLGPSA